ncbi:MAG: GAF domain-containing protein [Chloroflexi bacterium]|nr:GAF domain-containing protein [Chloroflexota bacterium]
MEQVSPDQGLFKPVPPGSEGAALIETLSILKTVNQQFFDQASQLIQELDSSLVQLGTEIHTQENERRQLSTLIEVSKAINSTLDLDEVLNLVIDMFISTSRAERGFLMLRETDSGQLVFKVARNMDRETIAGPAFEISRSIVDRVATDGSPILTTNASADPRFRAQASVISYSLRSILCVPLIVKGQTSGVVYVDNRIRTGIFSQKELEFLVALANQAAIAIENARLFASLKQKVMEITEMKNYMEHTFASIASGVVTVDAKGTVTTFNRAAERIFRFSAGEVIGRPYQVVLGALHENQLSGYIARLTGDETDQITCDIEPYLPTRGQVSLILRLSTLRNAAGEPIGVAIVIDDLTERKRLEAERLIQEQEKRRIKELFARYVAPTVVERLLSDPKRIALGGERHLVTVLFADIRGFTALAELMPAERLVVLLNGYLSLAARAVLKYEGTLDKFLGDAAMGVFNAPLPQPDHALLAAKAALTLREEITAYHESLPEEYRLGFSVGINSGEVIVGNVGTPEVMNYTVIGDAVNLAKRLQEAAQPGQILLSSDTYRLVDKSVQAKALTPLTVKGRSTPVQVYELIGLLP